MLREPEAFLPVIFSLILSTKLFFSEELLELLEDLLDEVEELLSLSRELLEELLLPVTAL